jgi:hypothetical protein
MGEKEIILKKESINRNFVCINHLKQIISETP